MNCPNWLRIGALVALTSLLAACGGGGENASPTPSTAELRTPSDATGISTSGELRSSSTATSTVAPLLAAPGDAGTLAVTPLALGAAASLGSDFNGDGKSDIVWRQVSTGRAILYLMNGGTLLSSIELGGNTDWSAVATGDFNGDGKADILWRQASTGNVLLNLMNSGTVLGSFVLGGNTEWVVAGVADFDGDGRSDILWRQVSTGRVIMYLMNGGSVLATD